MRGLQKLSACHDHHGNTPKSGYGSWNDHHGHIPGLLWQGNQLQLVWGLGQCRHTYNTDCPTNAQCKQTASINRSDAL